jgi:hypothetical protein
VTRLTLDEYRERVSKKPVKRARVNARPEAALKKAILARLTSLGYWVWVNNSGAVKASYKGRDRLIRMSPKGSPDIFVIGPRGRLCGLECKAPGGKRSPAQKAWQAKALSSGVGYRVVWTLAEAITAVSAWSVGAV